jgi:type IV pilus assembly protein PilA
MNTAAPSPPPQASFSKEVAAEGGRRFASRKCGRGEKSESFCVLFSSSPCGREGVIASAAKPSRKTVSYRSAANVEKGRRNNHNAFQRASGFTLLEMMIVLSVLAILLLIAVPTVQDSTIRKQIDNAIPLADIAKKPIDDARKNAHVLLPNNAAAGLPVPEKIVNQHIKAITIENGAIHLTFGYRANGAIKDKTLSLRPAIVEDAKIVPITWICGNANAPDPMTIKGQNRTDVPERYLPFACRASAK